jgi:hypothetical protein
MIRHLATAALVISFISLGFAQSSEPVITLQRTACFGTCPVYSLKIYADGRVTYEGKEFVKTKGRAKGRITKQALEELVEEFMKIHYLKLKSKPDCVEEWTDHPSALRSLSWKGEKNAVLHYHGCRGPAVLEQLTKLEDKIDEVVNSKRWIR